jgi:hypothetical protein
MDDEAAIEATIPEMSLAKLRKAAVEDSPTIPPWTAALEEFVPEPGEATIFDPHSRMQLPEPSLNGDTFDDLEAKAAITQPHRAASSAPAGGAKMSRTGSVTEDGQTRGAAAEAQAIIDRLSSAQGEALLELLRRAAQLRSADLPPVILRAIRHERAEARAWAVGMMRRFPRGHADLLLAQRLEDADSGVRLAALRLIAARRTSAAEEPLKAWLETDDLYAKELPEARVMILSYATLASSRAVPRLARLLNPGLHAKKNVEIQVIAALALGRLGGDEAREALRAGVRALHRRVRDACQAALLMETPSVDIFCPDTPETERTVLAELLDALSDRSEAPAPSDVSGSFRADPFNSVGRIELAQALSKPVGLGGGQTSVFPPAPDENREQFRGIAAQETRVVTPERASPERSSPERAPTDPNPPPRKPTRRPRSIARNAGEKNSS